ncbi:MAG: hypothetical protein ACP5US_00510 [Candidatus Kryptoniota bacterium]
MKTSIYYRILVCSVFLASVFHVGCSTPFEVRQDYKPLLTVYGLLIRDDSLVYLKVFQNSAVPVSDSLASISIQGLFAQVTESGTGIEIPFLSVDSLGTNVLVAKFHILAGAVYSLRVRAAGFPECSSTAEVVGSGQIEPTLGTLSAIVDPLKSQDNPTFNIYFSPATVAVSLSLVVRYDGFNNKGIHVRGEIPVLPSYQEGGQQALLKVNSSPTTIVFPHDSYMTAYSMAKSSIDSGSVIAVVKLLQVDGAIYDYYSISHGFNDPLTMRTEKPNYTNIKNGLGFWGSAAYDSLSFQL